MPATVRGPSWATPNNKEPASESGRYTGEDGWLRIRLHAESGAKEFLVQWRAEQARARAMSQATGVLENRVACALLSILGIATSVRSWLWITKVRHHRDIFSIDTL